ncbi:MAG: hypothetical protein ACMUEM_04885 [Flavobacteriales bacterium AspAUS03]
MSAKEIIPTVFDVGVYNECYVYQSVLSSAVYLVKCLRSSISTSNSSSSQCFSQIVPISMIYPSLDCDHTHKEKFFRDYQ